MSGLLRSGGIRRNLPDILLVHPALPCSSSDDDGRERNLQAESQEPEDLPPAPAHTDTLGQSFLLTGFEHLLCHLGS